MLSKEWIKHKAHEVVYSAGTRDPFKICEEAGIPYYYDDLGKEIMAYHTKILRVPAIVLSTRNSNFENRYACGHELGHHFCHHQGNTECLIVITKGILNVLIEVIENLLLLVKNMKQTNLW